MRIKVEKGSKEEEMLEKAGVSIIKKRENTMVSERYVYVVHPMEGLKLIGSLDFNYYEELMKLDSESNLAMLLDDVHLFDVNIVPNPNNSRQAQLGCVFVRYGRYLASDGDVIIELDKKSFVYQQYISFISGISLVSSLPPDKGIA